MKGKGFVPAGQLAVGNAIVTRAGPPATIKRIVRTGAKTVYNLTVAGDHTYFVGTRDGGVWVHNAGRCNAQQAASAIRKIANAIKDHATPSDIAGALRDMEGDPVIIGGKTYDHANEITDTLRGLRNNAELLQNSTHADAPQAINDARDAIDTIEGAMQGYGI